MAAREKKGAAPDLVISTDIVERALREAIKGDFNVPQPRAIEALWLACFAERQNTQNDERRRMLAEALRELRAGLSRLADVASTAAAARNWLNQASVDNDQDFAAQRDALRSQLVDISNVLAQYAAWDYLGTEFGLLEADAPHWHAYAHRLAQAFVDALCTSNGITVGRLRMPTRFLHQVIPSISGENPSEFAIRRHLQRCAEGCTDEGQ